MDIFSVFENRHSYRGAFAPTPVPREDLVRIVDAGIRAPSGCNAQTTSFVIVDDPEVLRAIADIVDKPVVRSARAMILCVVEHKPVYNGLSFAAEDCAAATENMLLAIAALGYATVWIDGVLRMEGRASRIAALLGVPPEREVRILLPVGRPAEVWRQREKLPFAERACFNRWPHRNP